MNVEKLMHGPVLTVRPDASVRNVAKMMVEGHVGSVIVVEGSELQGIVTDRDILRTLAGDASFDFDRQPIEKIMTRQVHFIGSEAPVEKAVDMMVQYGIKKLPVMRDGQLVGIITSTDIASDESEVLTSIRKLVYKIRRKQFKTPDFGGRFFS